MGKDSQVESTCRQPQQRSRLAVIVPVYNAQADYRQTMESLSKSTEPFDLVVVDDGRSPPLDPSGFRVHLIRLAQNKGQRRPSGLREHCWLLHSTLMFRAFVLAELGLYSDEYEAAEDYELCVRISSRCAVAVVPERLVTTDLKLSGITLNNRRTQLVSRLRVQLKYFSWTCQSSYVGVFKSLASILVPVMAVRWLKRNLIYEQLALPPLKNRHLT